MALSDDLKKVRLELNDPEDIIDIVEVADAGSLPATPASQTAYLQDDTGEYKVYENGSFTIVELEISDDMLSTWLTDYGVDQTVYRACNYIARRLGKRMQLVKLQSGAESPEYTAMLDQLKFYQSVRDDFILQSRREQKNFTGRMGKSSQPEIGGGNL